MRKNWHETAWDDYVAAQSQDRTTLNRINTLLKSIERNGYDAIGNIEPLRGNWSGWWSARIILKDRLIFRISGDLLEFAACKGHYS